MYVVRKPFRNYGKVLLPGSIVEPGNIKWFKSRLKDRTIIEVNEHNFDKWKEYFKVRCGVDITPAETNTDDETNASDETNTDNETNASDETKVDEPKRAVVTAIVR